MPDSPFARAKQQQPTASGRTAIRANQDAEICEFESTSPGHSAGALAYSPWNFARFVLSNVERIRFLFVFSSGKVMAKWKNYDAISSSSGYTRYEN
jgi:hypothetical protein